ncbi:MAG: hypothetical protein WAN11_07545 [Syntrophobacteraceae bacterium]
MGTTIQDERAFSFFRSSRSDAASQKIGRELGHSRKIAPGLEAWSYRLQRVARTRNKVRGHSQKIVPGLEASSYRLQRVARTRNEVRVQRFTCLFSGKRGPETK